MRTSPAVEQVKTLNGPRVRGISVRWERKRSMEEMICRRAKSSSERKTERVKEDASGDREDEDDDELPCIGESEGECLTRRSSSVIHQNLAKISGDFVPLCVILVPVQFQL